MLYIKGSHFTEKLKINEEITIINQRRKELNYSSNNTNGSGDFTVRSGGEAQAGVAAGRRGKKEEEVRIQDRRGPQKRHAPELRGEQHPQGFPIYTRHLLPSLTRPSFDLTNDGIQRFRALQLPPLRSTFFSSLAPLTSHDTCIALLFW